MCTVLEPGKIIESPCVVQLLIFEQLVYNSFHQDITRLNITHIDIACGGCCTVMYTLGVQFSHTLRARNCPIGQWRNQKSALESMHVFFFSLLPSPPPRPQLAASSGASGSFNAFMEIEKRFLIKRFLVKNF